MLSPLNFSGSPICKNFVGGFTCYSNVTVFGVPTCEYYGENGGSCYYKPKPPLPSRAYRIRTLLLGMLLYCLEFIIINTDQFHAKIVGKNPCSIYLLNLGYFGLEDK